jgi:hypothetical protein
MCGLQHPVLHCVPLVQSLPSASSVLQVRLPAIGSPQYCPRLQSELAWHSSASAQRPPEQRPVAHCAAAVQKAPCASSVLQVRLPAIGSPQYCPLPQSELAWHSSASAQRAPKQRPVAHCAALVQKAPCATSALQVRFPAIGSPQYCPLPQSELAWHSSASAQRAPKQRPVAHCSPLVQKAPCASSALQLRRPAIGSPQNSPLAQSASRAHSSALAHRPAGHLPDRH